MEMENLWGLMLLFYRQHRRAFQELGNFIFLFVCFWCFFVFLISLFLLIMGEFSLQDKLAYIKPKRYLSCTIPHSRTLHTIPLEDLDSETRILMRCKPRQQVCFAWCCWELPYILFSSLTCPELCEVGVKCYLCLFQVRETEAERNFVTYLGWSSDQSSSTKAVLHVFHAHTEGQKASRVHDPPRHLQPGVSEVALSPWPPLHT